MHINNRICAKLQVTNGVYKIWVKFLARLAPKENLKLKLVNIRKESSKIRYKSKMSPLMNVTHPINRLKAEGSMKMMTANSDTVIAMYLFYLLL